MEQVTDWTAGVSASPLGGLALFALAFIEPVISPVTTDPLLIALGVAQPAAALVFAVDRLQFLAGSIIGRGIRFFSIGLLIHLFGDKVR